MKGTQGSRPGQHHDGQASKRKRAVAVIIIIFTGRFCKCRISLCSRAADSLCSCRIHVIPNEWLAFYSALKNILLFIIIFFKYFRRSGVLTALFGCCMAGATWNCCRLCASSVYTIQPCTSLQCDFIQSHTGRVYVCLAVTCHLQFWQNDRDLVRATVVTRGWNGYRNKSQHRKSTLEKKILPPLLPGLKPGTFLSRVRRCNHWAIPAPQYMHVCTTYCLCVLLPRSYFRKKMSMILMLVTT